MRIILDTDKKTITVPWNYSDKLAEMNRIIAESGATDAKKLDFKNYIDDIWRYAMDNTDERLKNAQKQVRKGAKSEPAQSVSVANTVTEENK